jgi:acyl dehydratase
MSAPTWDSVEVGTVLPALSIPITRDTLVRYAGASGDFNLIHWNERVATAVGLPNVIAHGMLTMASAGRVLTQWTGDPGSIVEFSTRFSRPVVVPDDEVGATLEVGGTVAEKLEGNLVRISLSAKCQGQSVVGRATAVVRLP